MHAKNYCKVDLMKNFGIIKRLARYATLYKAKLLLLIMVGLAGVVFEVAKPLPIKIVVDNVLDDKPLPAFISGLLGNAALTDKYYLLMACVLLLVVIAVLSFTFTLLVFNLTVKLAQQLVYDLMVHLYQKLQQLSLSFYSRNKVGDLIQRMSADVFVAYFLIGQILIPALTSVVCLIAMFYIMARIDMVLAVVAFSVIPMLVITLTIFARPMNRTATEQYRTQGSFSAFLQQTLSSMKIIQAFGRESFMDEKLNKQAREMGRAFIKANKLSMTFNQFTVLITALTSAVLVLLGAYRGMNGNLSTGDLFVFLGYITALFAPVNSLVTAAGSAIAIGARGRRVFDIIDSDEVVKQKANPVQLPYPKGAIEFRNVTFGYPDGDGTRQEVLHDISFKIEPGQVVAIVGPTGAGKTSLISLLSRFYDPWKGEILLDGVNLADLELSSLRKNISIVLQEPFIFPMTVAENIAFGDPAASLDEIIEAAKNAQAHDFICRLPGGYETMLAESGSSLSGGEKQRIAIARALLKKAPLLILDEPTSAVDSLTEAKIFEAVNRISAGKTVFLISHKLSTIKHADQIITLNDGYVAEQGTHQALIERGELYADLYKYHHIT
jgi:ABC-type multidrug transport system fused ATPase/permease subunit